MAALVYPELAPWRGANVMIGHLRRLLRGGGPIPRDAGREPRQRRARRVGTSSARSRSNGAWARAPGSRTRPTSTAACCSRGGDARACAALLGEAADARRARRHADAARADRGDRRRRAAASPAGRPVAARGADARVWSPAGSATARSAPRCMISEHTAANHIRSILRKTGCANRTEAASYAHRHRSGRRSDRG